MPFVNANGVHIHYEETGNGEPLLLIMGLGADGSLWEQHVDCYKEHFRCIMMDNRGAGRSDKPKGPYTTSQMAADAIGLLDALGITKAHVSGISMGGAIAQEIAITKPERVKSLIIVSSWAKCDAYAVRVFQMFKDMIQASDPVAFNRLLQLWIFTPEYHNLHMDDLLLREENSKLYPYPMPLHSFLAQCDACINHNTVGRLKKIVAPALVTVGDRDIFTPLHYSRYIAEVIPKAELYIVKGGGHTHHWERLSEFNQRTLEFLLKGNVV